MKRVYIVLAIVAVLGWIAIGMLVAKGPQPEIVVPAEIITTLGPLNITNTLLTAWLVMAMIIGFGLIATRAMKVMPSGIQNFAEAVVDFLLSQCEEIAGREKARALFAFVATIFIFVLVSNWFGLLPFFNAIGKTEDVGHEVFLVMAEHAEDGHAFEEDEHFFAWKMADAGGFGLVKPGGDTFEFEVHAEEEPAAAADRYIVALAQEFTGFEPEGAEAGDLSGAGDFSAATVQEAFERLAADPSAPKVLLASDAGGEDAHGIESPALGEVVTGVDFPEQKLALVIPYFRSVFSDVNHTLALALCAFVFIEVMGLRTIGIGYLGRFFVNPFRPPYFIGSVVGFLELLSEFIRIISFTFRLFGNIFAGEVLILMLTFLVPFLVVDIIYGLELFVGFIQAAVFALLTLVFASMAMEHHGDEHEEQHDPETHEIIQPGAAQAH
ncbi:MAG: F0F1 ATP synthase subunit A [Dehalococcoidia bacterium]